MRHYSTNFSRKYVIYCHKIALQYISRSIRIMKLAYTVLLRSLLIFIGKCAKCSSNENVLAKCMYVCDCSVIDYCLSLPCQHHGTCTKGINSYTCSCTVGYTGPNCAQGIMKIN